MIGRYLMRAPRWYFALSTVGRLLSRPLRSSTATTARESKRCFLYGWGRCDANGFPGTYVLPVEWIRDGVRSRPLLLPALWSLS